MKKNFLILLVFSCFFSLFAQSKIVRVGFEIPKDPETGRPYGYDYNYFQELAKYTGWSYEFVDGTNDDYINLLEKGEIDVMVDFPEYSNRKNTVRSNYYYKILDCYLFSRAEDTGIIWEESSTFAGKKIGVVKASPSSRRIISFVNENNLDVEIVATETFPELMTKFLDEKTIDMVCLADYFAALYKGLIAVVPVYSIDVYLRFYEKNPEFIEKFTYAQEQIQKRSPAFLRRQKELHFEFRNPVTKLYPEEKKWISQNDSVSIGFVKGGFPFCEVLKDGNGVGAIPEYLERIFSEMGLSNLKITYKSFDTYLDAVEALKNSEIDLLAPVYGDYYDAEKYGFMKTDNFMDMELGLIYKKSRLNKSEQILINRSTFEFLNSYKSQFLKDYKYETKGFSRKMTFHSLLRDPANVLLLSEYTIMSLLNTVNDREYVYEKLYNKCPLAFGVRRDDLGLLSVINTGISKIEPNYIYSMLFDFSIQNREYSFSEYLRENLGKTFIVIGTILVFIFLVIGLYINEIQNNKVQLEKSKQEVDKALMIAEVANRAKTNFLNNVSHDIRTPMNAIIGFTDLAQKSIGDNGKIKEYLSKIQISSLHLLNLINDVLDMGRIESGKVILESNPESLVAMVDELKTILQPDIEKKRIDFTIDTNTVKHQTVMCDRLRMNQIILNLLSNAVKFTAEKGKVEFILREEELALENKSKYKIIVRDNGIGMSEDFQRTLFEAFERENTSTISKIQGTGLGMSITKKLIEMMGGSISVKSEKGIGTEITIVMNLITVDNNVEIAESSETPDHIEERKLLNDKKILLVEDNEMNQEIAVNILKEYGCCVTVAENGEQAIKKVKTSAEEEKNHFDLILMDIQMPVMNGYDATKNIRAMEDNYCRKVPIFAMTANAFEEDKKEAIFAGMNGHIAKPVNLDELVNTLVSTLSSKN